MIERKPIPTRPIGPGDTDTEGEGPTRKKATQPDAQEALKRMRKVDKEQSRRYRQRTGE